MKDNGLRLLLVGYESGDDQILHNIKKGLRTDIARRFSEDCRKLGIMIHGTFILGLPGRDAGDDPEDHRVREGDQSAHHPGVARRALSRHDALQAGRRERLAAGERGHQPGQREGRAAGRDQLSAPVDGRDLSQLEDFYKRFYFRPSKIWEIVREMLMSWDMMKRRLREGVEFFRFLRAHQS